MFLIIRTLRSEALGFSQRGLWSTCVLRTPQSGAPTNPAKPIEVHQPPPSSSGDPSVQVETVPKPSKIDRKKEASERLEQQRLFRKQQEDTFAPFRYVYPEFLPSTNPEFRNRIREKLERMDMLKRRSQIDIPEFYAGSVLKVVVSDPNSPDKTNMFVGICTERGGTGLKAWFVLRNHVDGHGVEIMYELYNPSIRSIAVLKLEKRLDENLRYLRDAPPEYSTFPFDMPQEVRSPDAPVPVNAMKIKLKPKPWSAKWHLWGLEGIQDVEEGLTQMEEKKFKTFKQQTNSDHDKYDLMRKYRHTIPVEDQVEIFGEVQEQLQSLTHTLRSQKRKRTFARPQKSA